jgi:hypothetical protein
MEYIAVSKGRIRKLEKINRLCKLEDAFNICKKEGRPQPLFVARPTKKNKIIIDYLLNFIPPSPRSTA